MSPGVPVNCLQSRDLRVSHGSTQILDLGGTFSIQPGLTVLLGRNGAGKSTLMRVLASVQRPSSGDVVWRQASLTGQLRAYQRSLGWLPQNPGMPPQMSLVEFIRHVAWLREVGRPKREEAVSRCLGLVNLSGLRHRRLGTLSGGERRRAALAATIVGDPQVIMLDEPTAGLDPEQRAELCEQVAKLDDGRRILVLSTHLMEDVAALQPPRLIVLDEGRIRADASPSEITGIEVPDALALTTAFRRLLRS